MNSMGYCWRIPIRSPAAASPAVSNHDSGRPLLLSRHGVPGADGAGVAGRVGSQKRMMTPGKVESARTLLKSSMPPPVTPPRVSGSRSV